MNFTRQELGTPTKLVGFVVGTVLLFFLAMFVGRTIGPDASPPEPMHSDHDSHGAIDRTSTGLQPVQDGYTLRSGPAAGTFVLYPGFQHQGVAHTATFVIDAEGNRR